MVVASAGVLQAGVLVFAVGRWEGAAGSAVEVTSRAVMETDGVLVTAIVLMEAGPIDPGTNELVYGLATIVIGVLLVAVVVGAVLLTVRSRRQREARLSAVERRLATLEEARDRGGS